jgi:hypothetical protein
MSRTVPLLAAALCAAAFLFADLPACRGDGLPPAERRIEQALASPTQLEFIETPLQDVVDHLKDFHQIEVQICCKTLDDVGVGSDTPVSTNLKGLSLRSALNLMLSELDLTYVVQNEVLLITTPEDARGRLLTKVYPVADCQAMIEVIITTIAPGSWKDGPGSIAGTSSGNTESLVVTQTYDVHGKIARLLDELPKAIRHEPLVVGQTAAGLKIEQTLARPTEMKFIDTPLQDVVDYLKQRHRIEIQIDTRALDDVGIGQDTPIDKSLKGISLRSALRLILRELDLTYMIDNEVLLITTPEEAESRLHTTIYPVGDLLASGDKSAFPGDGNTLIDVITTTIQPTTWDEVGGPGSISGASFGNVEVLVISQAQYVHEEITGLIETLRRLIGRDQPGTVQPATGQPCDPAVESHAEPAKQPPDDSPAKQPRSRDDDPFAE